MRAPPAKRGIVAQGKTPHLLLGQSGTPSRSQGSASVERPAVWTTGRVYLAERGPEANRKAEMASPAPGVRSRPLPLEIAWTYSG